MNRGLIEPYKKAPSRPLFRRVHPANHAYAYERAAPFFWPIVLTFTPCFLVNFQAIHAQLGAPILIIVAIVSFFSPYSGLLFLVATQIIPDISPDFPLKNADLAVIGWTLVTGYRFIFSPKKFHFEIPKNLLIWMIPFLAWALLCSSIHGDFGLPVIIGKAAIISFIAWNLVSQAKGRYDLCLLAILIGGLLALPGYWGRQWGYSVYIPEELEIYMKSSSRGGARIGSGRGDSNTIYPFLISAIVGFLALAVSRTPITDKNNSRNVLYLATVLVMMLCIPAAVATMSRGVFLCAAGSFFFLVIFNLRRDGHHWSLGKKACVFFGLVAMTSAALLWSPQQEALSYRTIGVLNFWEHMGLLGGRSNTYNQGIEALRDFPYFGLDYKEYTVKYTAGTYSIAHNTFLDTGITSGIPGLLLCVLFLGAPFLYLYKNRKKLSLPLPAIVVYCNWMIYAQVIACLNTKVIWCLWVLMVHQFVSYGENKYNTVTGKY